MGRPPPEMGHITDGKTVNDITFGSITSFNQSSSIVAKALHCCRGLHFFRLTVKHPF